MSYSVKRMSRSVKPNRGSSRKLEK
jgi:hypothetical protein